MSAWGQDLTRAELRAEVRRLRLKANRLRAKVIAARMERDAANAELAESTRKTMHDAVRIARAESALAEAQTAEAARSGAYREAMHVLDAQPGEDTLVSIATQRMDELDRTAQAVADVWRVLGPAGPDVTHVAQAVAKLRGERDAAMAAVEAVRAWKATRPAIYGIDEPFFCELRAVVNALDAFDGRGAQSSEDTADSLTREWTALGDPSVGAILTAWVTGNCATRDARNIFDPKASAPLQELQRRTIAWIARERARVDLLTMDDGSCAGGDPGREAGVAIVSRDTKPGVVEACPRCMGSGLRSPLSDSGPCEECAGSGELTGTWTEEIWHGARQWRCDCDEGSGNLRVHGALRCGGCGYARPAAKGVA